jgi:hypothetical protein
VCPYSARSRGGFLQSLDDEEHFIQVLLVVEAGRLLVGSARGEVARGLGRRRCVVWVWGLCGPARQHQAAA